MLWWHNVQVLAAIQLTTTVFTQVEHLEDTYPWEPCSDDTMSQCRLPLQFTTTVFTQVERFEDVLELYHLQNIIMTRMSYDGAVHY